MTVSTNFNQKSKVDFLTLIKGATESATENTTSQFSNTIKLGQDKWAVTMICYVGTNHAQLAIEGVNTMNKVFMVIAELNGMSKTIFNIPYGYKDLGEVNCRLLNERSRLKYDGKSETWERTQTEMLKMIDVIYKEHLDPDNYPVPFHICGARSLFAAEAVFVKGVGCEVAKYKKGFYALIASTVFLGIAAYCYKCPESVQAAVNASRQELCEMMRKNFMASVTNLPPIEGVDSELMFQMTFPELIGTVDVTAIRQSLLASTATVGGAFALDMHEQTKPAAIEAKMIEKHKDKEVCRLVSNNCCTWGKIKLAIIGINFPETEEQRFITITRRITNPNEIPMAVPGSLSCSITKGKKSN